MFGGDDDAFEVRRCQKKRLCGAARSLPVSNGGLDVGMWSSEPFPNKSPEHACVRRSDD